MHRISAHILYTATGASPSLRREPHALLLWHHSFATLLNSRAPQFTGIVRSSDALALLQAGGCSATLFLPSRRVLQTSREGQG